jgi:uncharacterized phage-associated protein
MCVSASDVAKYIIRACHAKGDPANNLKLQKLLYYTQAWHLALYDTPLFYENIEAWVHGPVIPAVFREYRSFKWSPITLSGERVKLPTEATEHVEEVLSVYEAYNAWDLERLTHNEDPWKEARGNMPPDMASSVVISHDSMKRYYRQMVNG